MKSNLSLNRLGIAVRWYSSIGCVLLGLSWLGGGSAHAQQPGADTAGTALSARRGPALGLKNIQFSGYYRFYGYHRLLTDPYAMNEPAVRTIAVGDGYREPLLDLILVGTPAPNVTFATDLFYFTPYRGNQEGNTFITNLGINFYGNIKTDHGVFNLRAGGISWIQQSPLTVWNNETFQRFSVFDRTPWEEADSVTRTYDQYFNQGAINFGNRFGRRAFQGVMLECYELPGKFALSGFFGKTQNNPGVPSLPDYAYGGRLSRGFKEGKYTLALNTFNSQTQLDSIQPLTRQYGNHTVEGIANFAGFTLNVEAGAGRFTSPTLQLDWGGAVIAKLVTPKRYTGIPLEFSFYQISPGFVNVNAGFLNTSVLEVQNNQAGVGANVLTPFGGPIVDVGQPANNRRGYCLNGQIDIGRKLKLNFGLGISEELQRGAAQVSFFHRITALPLSRMALFAQNVGPYARMNTIFRGAYEVVNVNQTDSTGVPTFDKHFTSADFQLKYADRFLGRRFYLFFLTTANTVQPKISFIPAFNNDAFVRVLYSEADVHIELHRNVLITGYAGIQRIWANGLTDLDAETGLPRNQTAHTYGVGLDVMLAKNTGVYLRQRWFDHRDRNFRLDHFGGYETTLEIKTFF